MTNRFDLGKYFNLFPEACLERYGQTFEEGFARIERRFQGVRSGARPLTVDDVFSIFDADLPYIQDWTKPDRANLTDRMHAHDAAGLVRSIALRVDVKTELRKLIYCFRELSLTALVLHQIYPDRFAMCSHHLASQLCVAGATGADYYLRYCEELKAWSEHGWATKIPRCTVVQAEFALWTWYRRSAVGPREARKAAESEFFKDHWIRERRAAQIANSTRGVHNDLLLARAFIHKNANVAAVIGWWVLALQVKQAAERQIGRLLTKQDSIWSRIDMLTEADFPDGWNGGSVRALWEPRNRVMKEGGEVSLLQAKRILGAAEAFVDQSRQREALNAFAAGAGRPC